MRDLGPVESVSDVLAHLQKDLEKFHRHSVKDFSRETLYSFPFGIWFRGQGHADHDLTPHAFRECYDETSMFHHFQVRSPEHWRVYRSVFDWLCLMQHYELPTRLLDWSESVLVALYFAVYEEKYSDSDGQVYALNARRLNRLTNLRAKRSGERGVCSPWSPNTVMRAQLAVARNVDDWRQRMRSVTGSESPRTSVCRQVARYTNEEVLSCLACPVAVLPSRLNGRMIFQSSCFTVHGGKRYMQRKAGVKGFLPEPISLKQLDGDQRKSDRQFLLSFTVPFRHKPAILKELQLLGIHPGSLFPEVDRQAQHIKSLWHLDPHSESHAGAAPVHPG
jgi:hypothetical protein